MKTESISLLKAELVSIRCHDELGKDARCKLVPILKRQKCMSTLTVGTTLSTLSLHSVCWRTRDSSNFCRWDSCEKMHTFETLQHSGTTFEELLNKNMVRMSNCESSLCIKMSLDYDLWSSIKQPYLGEGLLDTNSGNKYTEYRRVAQPWTIKHVT